MAKTLTKGEATKENSKIWEYAATYFVRMSIYNVYEKMFQHLVRFLSTPLLRSIDKYNASHRWDPAYVEEARKELVNRSLLGAKKRPFNELKSTIETIEKMYAKD